MPLLNSDMATLNLGVKQTRVITRKPVIANGSHVHWYNRTTCWSRTTL